MGKASLFTVIASAALSVYLMLYAGRHQPSLLLTLLFAIWVLLPFIAGIAARVSIAAPVVALTSLLIYAGVAFDVVHAKLGFVFLVVPFVSLIAIGAAAFVARKRSGVSRLRL